MTGQAPSSDQSVCAVVVTRNRRELLRRCLQAIADQERPVEQVVVVDNASDDGSPALVRAEFPSVTLLGLSQNLGGAGGFAHGMAWAHERGYGWLWLMDDDTLAEPGALRALLAGAGRAPGGQPLIVASAVHWKDERLHPMNRVLPRWRRRGELARDVSNGLLLMRYATFVSIAVRREAIDRFGLPLAGYFVRGDDVEYTARVLKHEPGFLVADSHVHHWTAQPQGPDASSDERFYYLARNSLWLLRGTSFAPIDRFDYGRWFARAVLGYVWANRRDGRRLQRLARGVRDGLRGQVR